VPAPGLDVVVVAHRSSATLRAALDSAGRIPGCRQLIVVDQGEDGSGELAEAHGARVLRPGANRGFGAGQNLGLRAASAPLALLLNPDARVVPDAVAEGARLFGQRRRLGALQGVVLGPDGRPQRSQGVALGPAHLWGRALGASRWGGLAPARLAARAVPRLRDHVERVPPGPGPVGSLAATCLLVRREAFWSVGGFDEGYFLYGEDLDLCRRLAAAGWELWATPETWATHLGGASFADPDARELEWWRGTLAYARRWWAPPARAGGGLAALALAARLARARPALSRDLAALALGGRRAQPPSQAWRMGPPNSTADSAPAARNGPKGRRDPQPRRRPATRPTPTTPP
jgi:N-acetylglucosaminyl-diphospho-decaprenol L-rhamnosyltransferase